MKTIIELKNINKSFGKNIVINNLNLDIEEGKVTGIIGRNGSGKTVLLKIMCGLYIPNEGSVLLNGEKLLVDKPNNLFGILIDTNFLDNETAYKNLKLLSYLDKKITDKDIFAVLDKVGLDFKNKTKYRNYSTGMKQKLKLAQVLLFKPSILILDEPFNGLDEESVTLFRNIIKEYRENHATIIITSHYREDIELLCDYVYKMEKGVLRKADGYEKFKKS